MVSAIVIERGHRAVVPGRPMPRRVWTQPAASKGQLSALLLEVVVVVAVVMFGLRRRWTREAADGWQTVSTRGFAVELRGLDR